MSTGLIWSNVLAYSLQIGLVVGLGAVAPAILRIRIPRARLLFWQLLLVACLALPWVREWRQEVVSGTVQITMAMSAAPVSAPGSRAIPLVTIALWLLAAGIVVRLGCLAVGLFRLRAYRRRGEEITRELRVPGMPDRISIMLSEDIAGPVTFGWRSPVILLPADFPSLDAGMRDAILCHELMHVERRDWLFTIAEELLRSVLWFHPAIWWVIGEIQLSREQCVDESVIDTTRAKGVYVDALLLMAGANPGESHADLAPAPMFLRKRHLKRRLMEMMREVRMTKVSGTRLTCVMGAAIMMICGACWLASGAFPLAAAPQFVEDAAGVAVNTGGSQLMHRTRVPYPSAARAKGIEGTVVAQLKLDGNGEVMDASILSGPDELRKAVLQAVLAWHFDKSDASDMRTVSIRFVAPERREAPSVTIPASPVFGAMVTPVAPRTSSVQNIERVEAASVPDEPGDPTVFSVGHGIRPPTLISKVEPQYTDEARDAGYSGAVMLSVVVGTDGKAEDFRVIKSLGMGLDEKAIEAVQQWRFNPGTNGGEPVKVRAQIEVNFRLL